MVDKNMSYNFSKYPNGMINLRTDQGEYEIDYNKYKNIDIQNFTSILNKPKVFILN